MEAKAELDRVLQADELRDSCVLVLANKADLPNSMKPDEMAQKLGLQQLKGRQWYIQSTCATSGEGIYEGMNWLCETVAKMPPAK